MQILSLYILFIALCERLSFTEICLKFQTMAFSFSLGWNDVNLACVYIRTTALSNCNHPALPSLRARVHWTTNVRSYTSLKLPAKYLSTTAEGEMIVIPEWRIWVCCSPASMMACFFTLYSLCHQLMMLITLIWHIDKNPMEDLE